MVSKIITTSLLLSVLFSSTLAVPLGKGAVETGKQMIPEFNPDLFEGDIMGVDPKDILAGKKPKNGVTDKSLLWPDATIYYEIVKTDFSQNELNIIQTAFDEYHAKTCLKFVEWTDQPHRVVIQKTGGGCYSYIGMQRTRLQPVSLDTGCFGGNLPGTPIHELMHASGFFHEQSRTDRDDYVLINYDNIQPGYESNFDSYGPDELDLLGTEYDYGSVMHYPPYGFAIDPTIPTIIPIPDPNVEIGQRRGFSDTDVEELNILYNCPPRS